ncbi:YkgJ family cysteine cluster protein [Desulforudis sp. 1088]|uniref:YkgJ family cysteine cluster protein n=1 Tax=unclassified Candidatus Desulforudis TaxID=2635950 RepID=UPI003BC1EE17
MSEQDLTRISQVVSQDLQMGDKFTFECTDRCMGMCCQRITIHLDPWDVETMARYLEMPGKDFLDEFCGFETVPGSWWPVVWLKHARNGPCVFLNQDGKCVLYPHRSRNCRSFPVGRAVRVSYQGDTPEIEERYFMIKRMHYCLGHEGAREWTVGEWLDKSEVHTHNEMCDLYIELVSYVDQKLNGRAWMSPATAKMITPILYGPDMLRAKLSITEKQVSHEEFYRRRIKALREILTDMAAHLGFGPRAGKPDEDGLTVMEKIKRILTTGVK